MSLGLLHLIRECHQCILQLALVWHMPNAARKLELQETSGAIVENKK